MKGLYFFMNKILIIDFGSQYTQLIARKIREIGIYTEVTPYFSSVQIDENVKGIILSGSPYSVDDNNAPTWDFKAYEAKVPILGICYGAQLMIKNYGGKVQKSARREFGAAILEIKQNDILFKDVSNKSVVWMSHSDTISILPKDFTIIASTNNIPVAAFRARNKNLWGLQFHPEVFHTQEGIKIFRNFATEICKIEANWSPSNFIKNTIEYLRETIKNDRVIMAVSGGVDSSVAAVLLHKAIGKNLYSIFVNTGLLREGEFQEVLDIYRKLDLNVIPVNAEDIFLEKLSAVADPEQKRKIIGSTFIEVFMKEAEKISDVKWLAQGTIYPDVIESATDVKAAKTIKSHHNVGGLPQNIKFKIIEPLRVLFKDEVRKVGEELGLPKEILYRHPFPGPGLAIRIIGEVSPQKIKILRKADKIFIDELKKHDLYNKVWQAATILLPVKTVGIMGDERSYQWTIVLRAVNSVDGMTADWSRLPYDFIADVSNKIINDVNGVNRVVYDITSKPPATIEWE